MLKPEIFSNYFVWFSSMGWQIEIELWNIGIGIGILITLIKWKVEYAEILTIIATILCFLLGGHHFYYAITSTNGNTLLHWIGTVEVMFFGGIAGLLAITKSKIKNSI